MRGKKRERTHEHRQQCGDWWGWGVKEGIEGINGNGKKNKEKVKMILLAEKNQRKSAGQKINDFNQ